MLRNRLAQFICWVNSIQGFLCRTGRPEGTDLMLGTISVCGEWEGDKTDAGRMTI